MNKILDKFLKETMDNRGGIAIFLQNGIKLVGYIEDFNEHCVRISLYNNKDVISIVMLHAISSFSLHNAAAVAAHQ